jgi:hypothetical protein
MSTRKTTWQPSYLTNRFYECVVGFLFASMNVVMMVETALPKTKGAVPSFWWPVLVAGTVLIGFIYWAGFRLLQLKWGNHSSVGKKLGFEVIFYKGGDENIPERMRVPIVEAEIDGTRRRLYYKVCIT